MPTRLPKEVYYYGKVEPLPRQTKLKAGPFNLIYEAGSLRYIKLGDFEVIRSIYSAVRDCKWGTLTPNISNENIQINPASFLITFDGEFKNNEIDFSAKFFISGDESGKILMKLDGLAKSTFLKNRIGLCLLHPISTCAGKPIMIVHSDGSNEQGLFPKSIVSNQIFIDIISMQWEITDTCKVRLNFEGDIFEMEDQRNWTDTSFKTYSTPLHIPFPAEIKEGEKVNQVIELQLMCDFIKQNLAEETYLLTELNDFPKIPLPKIGICKSSETLELSSSELFFLKDIQFSHYRINLKLFDPEWLKVIKSGINESTILNAPIEAVLFFSENFENELSQFINNSKLLNASIKHILILKYLTEITPINILDFVIEPLRNNFPLAKIGIGTDSFYFEINKNHLLSEKVDFIFFSINPQMHLFDNQTIVENLEAQADVVESAKLLANKIDIFVSPVSLKPQKLQGFPDNISIIANTETINCTDVRQMSLFGAGWTLGSIKYLSESGVNSVTYFETIGTKGIIQGDNPPNPFLKFQSCENAFFPIFHILATILDFEQGYIIKCLSNNPLEFNGLILENLQEKRVIIVNHNEKEKTIFYKGSEEFGQIRCLDEENVEEAMYEPSWYIGRPKEIEKVNDQFEIFLKPFGIAVLDFMK